MGPIKRARRSFTKRWIARELYPFTGKDETKLVAKAREQNLARTSYDKVFCIGYNKTGTTTLETVLRDLGLKLPDIRLQEQLTSHVLATGRFEMLKRFVTQYDAFQDLPFSQDSIYVVADALFPNSKFILTERDPDAWFRSLVNFHKKVFAFEDETKMSPDFFKDRTLYLHKNYDYQHAMREVAGLFDGTTHSVPGDLYSKPKRIAAYLRRNEEIKYHFRNRPNDLLVIDITKEKDTARICEFLGFDASRVSPMPHKNETSKRPDPA